MKRTLFLVMLSLSFSAMAATYKCTVDGKIVYSDKPCAAGDTLKMKGGVPVQDKGIMTKPGQASAAQSGGSSGKVPDASKPK